MTLGKRAFLYLTRKKARSVLLIALIFIMASFVLVGTALKSGADAETQKLQKTLGGSFVLKADTKNQENYEVRNENGYSYMAYTGSVVTENMVNSIMEVEGVEDYTVRASELVWADLALKPGLYAGTEENEYISQEEVEVRRQTTLALPCRNGELHDDFRTGAFSMTEGRNIEENDNHMAVISSYLAKQNGLSVGDTFTIELKEGIFQPSDTPKKTWGKPIELKIIGLFQTNFEQEPSVYTSEESYTENLIFTDLHTETELKQYRKVDAAGAYGEVVFFVDNPRNLDFIMEQIKEKNARDLEGLVFKRDDVAYRASVKPLQQIDIFAMILIMAGISGCGIILYLVFVMWIRGRKQEIGILLSIGICKMKIVVQMILECLLVSGIALILTFLLSGGITEGCCRVAERLTAPGADVQTYEIEEEYGRLEPVVNKVSADAIQLDSQISFWSVFIMMFVICMISVGSVSLASIQIMRLEPKRLLQSM